MTTTELILIAIIAGLWLAGYKVSRIAADFSSISERGTRISSAERVCLFLSWPILTAIYLARA